MADPKSWDWDEVLELNRHWLGEPDINAWDDNSSVTSTDPDEPFVIVHCAVCGFREDKLSNLVRRWDGVLVHKRHNDLEPRNRRSNKFNARPEKPRTLGIRGAFTFGQDFEGRS